MASFELLPAIDLVGGRVVRLRQGDFAQATTYADDPAGVALAFADAGATWLHVVDLDGAREGRPVQADAVARLVAAVSRRVAIEVAGGLRTDGGVAAALGTGVRRVVVGTAALADPGWVGSLVASHGPEAIAIAIDVREGLAVGDGWVAGSHGLPARDAIARLAAVGARWFEVTAIDRDGTLEGPDLGLLEGLVAAAPGAAIVASGGIRSIADLHATRAIGCAGAIVGRALYDRTLDLGAALAALRSD